MIGTFYDDHVTRKAFLILNNHVESVNYKFQPCLTPLCLSRARTSFQLHDTWLTARIRYELTSTLDLRSFVSLFTPFNLLIHETQLRRGD
jgi:hypothetical protein